VVKKNVVAATALVSSTEAFPTAGLALQLEVLTVMTSIPSLKVGEECWNPGLDGRLEVIAANISYHPSNPHHHFHPTHQLPQAAPPGVGATKGSST
jgi:hypothetical protein